MTEQDSRDHVRRANASLIVGVLLVLGTLVWAVNRYAPGLPTKLLRLVGI